MLTVRRWVLLYLVIVSGCETIDHRVIDATADIDAEPIVAFEQQVIEAPPELVRADVWSVLRDGFALDHADEQPAVATAVESLLSGPPMLSALETRARRYLAYIVDEVNRRNLPMELALLPIIESALNPYAYSPRGASGLWQLIPATAKHYGITINAWYDGRRDLVDSTAAALDYLTYLHDALGDWMLAIAAYNGGEGRIRRALAATPDAGFFDLRVPAETRAYVPKLLALAHLVAQGNDAFVLPQIDAVPPFFATTLDGQVDLVKVANLGPLSVDNLFHFNAGLNRRATPPAGTCRLLVLSTDREAFANAIDRYPKERVTWKRHVVRRGESLAAIANRYHTSVAVIRSNNPRATNPIHPNQSLLIASSAIEPGKLQSNPLLNTNRHLQRYRIRSGDSLSRIGHRFDTTVAQLIRANSLEPHTKLQVGQVLLIPGKHAAEFPAYTVQRGE